VCIRVNAVRAPESDELWSRIEPLLLIRIAAWQPLVAKPGTTYHHSNIGWNIAGLIAAKVGGKPLPTLYRERICSPGGKPSIPRSARSRTDRPPLASTAARKFGP
jgi:CubicO group peptidase (beta-lactamase class C family)